MNEQFEIRLAPLRQPTTTASPPRRASRVRESENCKYKQHAITSGLHLQFFDFLCAGPRPAAADGPGSFGSSYLRFFAVKPWARVSGTGPDTIVFWGID
jgi:hypothetical protein